MSPQRAAAFCLLGVVLCPINCLDAAHTASDAGATVDCDRCLANQVGGCEEEVARLRAEVRDLKAKLALLSFPPREVSVDNLPLDLPVSDRTPHSRALASSGDSNLSDCPEEHSQGDAHAGSEHEYETLVFLFAAVVLGTGLLHLTTFPVLHNMQFTVVLFVLGFICDIIAEKGELDEWAPLLYRSYSSWVNVDPHLLLFTFLPALLCGDAMTIDTHVAKRCAKQCLWLAGPGVIFGAFSTAAVLYYVLPYDWDISTCVTVGSILAATDPVAVVSLLKDLGASPVLTILIQGESLLNDGTAMVLFTVAYNIAGGEKYTAGRFILYLFSSTLGAATLGLCIGMTFLIWIRKANDKFSHSSALIQISLTLACAYWSFILAEGVFHISGVLSTVAAALVLAHRMWPVLVERRAMLEIWHVIETVGNTLVFFLAGVLTGNAALAIEAEDIAWSVVVYLACIIIRTTMLLLFKPILGRLGEPVMVQDVLVMSWGGLRGMVGLALAILVKKDLADGNLDQKDGDRILFMVGSVAALTLILNATTCPALTKVLGVAAAPKARTELLRNVARRAHQHLQESMQGMLSDRRAMRRVGSPQLVEQLVERLLVAVAEDEELQGAKGDDGLPMRFTSSKAVSSFLPLVPGQDATDGSMPSAANFTSSISAGHRGISVRLQTILKGKQLRKNVEDLWNHFDDARKDLLRSGADIEAFQFGRQMQEIKDLLAFQPCKDDMLQIVREVFLEAVRAQYWEQLQHARFSDGGTIPQALFNSVNMAKDKCHSGLMDWQVLRADIEDALDPGRGVGGISGTSWASERSTATSGSRSMAPTVSTASSKSHSPNKLARIGSWTSDTSVASRNGWLLVRHVRSLVESARRIFRRQRRRHNYQKQTQAIQIINAFIDAHLQAQVHVAAYFGESESVDTPEGAFVILESQTAVFEAAAARSLIGKEVQSHVNTMWEVHRLADTYRNYIVNAFESGVLQGKEAETLLHPIDSAMRSINKERKKIHALILKALKSRKAMTQLEAALLIQRHLRNRKKVRRMRRKSVHLTASLANTLNQIPGCVPVPPPRLSKHNEGDERDQSDCPSDCTSSEQEDAQSLSATPRSFRTHISEDAEVPDRLPQYIPHPLGAPKIVLEAGS